eukprot:TRINITY_DN1864_c0_g1_i3.p1 TRINITY_DN1864_c0_g1~~TRINITY_DN1864_c0_g1_i3.p1  ORF type:complete len:131 (-),score=0.53 TRINITY_DN1864_c0_g1_i3:26-418(-)
MDGVWYNAYYRYGLLIVLSRFKKIMKCSLPLWQFFKNTPPGNRTRCTCLEGKYVTNTPVVFFVLETLSIICYIESPIIESSFFPKHQIKEPLESKPIIHIRYNILDIKNYSVKKSCRSSIYPLWYSNHKN